MKFYGKKRVGRKVSKGKARSTRRAGKKMSFAKRVQKVVAKDIETKVVNFSSNVTAFNQQIQTSGDCLRLMPQVAAGTGQNQRIGASIKLQGLKLRGVMTFTLGQTVATNTRIGVRLMIVKAKRFGDWNAALTDFGTNYTRLLEGSATGFTGLVTDFNTPINKDYFTVVADKRMYMSLSVGTSTIDNINTTKFVNMNIPYSRRKVEFDDSLGTTTESINYPYFMLVGYTKLDGSVADATLTTYLTFQWNTTAYYEDA